MSNDISLPAGMRSNLINLQTIGLVLNRTQARLASGKKVNSALDNPTNFFAAQDNLNRASDLGTRKDGVSEAIQAIKAATSGITAISSLLSSARGIANAAMGTNDQASRVTYSLQFDETLSQIDSIKNDSGYQGTDMLNSQSLTVNFSETSGQSTLDLIGVDGSSTGLGVSRANTSSGTSGASTTSVSNNVTIGGSYPVLVNADGTVTVDNGDGTTSQQAGLTGVVSVSSGNSFSFALKSDGTVAAWGDDSSGQVSGVSGLTNVTAISAGSGSGTGFGLALRMDGTVAAWGDNSLGQTTIPSGLTGVVAISAGYGFGMALKSDGTVVGWGDNSSGQTDPTSLAALTGITAISAGNDFGLALKGDATVAAWGSDASGQVSGASALSGITAISAGGNGFGLALASDGSVAGWGDNSFGQTDPSTLSALGTGNIAISAGVFDSLVLDNTGSIAHWGAFAPYTPLSGAKTTGSSMDIVANSWTITSGIQTSLDQLDTAVSKGRAISTSLSSNNNIITTWQSFTDSRINILWPRGTLLSWLSSREQLNKLNHVPLLRPKFWCTVWCTTQG